MDKGVGFNRNIKLEWLEATAVLCTQLDDPAEIRARLQPILAEDRSGQDAIRKSIDILLNIWFKNRDLDPRLYAAAIHQFQTTQIPTDRLWLHYGLTLLYYPFFWQCVTAVGQLGRYGDTITNRTVIKRMVAEVGQLGSLERSVQRVVWSLHDWGILADSPQRYVYEACTQQFTASNKTLESWLLACALQAHPAQELPFADLLHLPGLFPFQFTVTVPDLRPGPLFEVHRQGLGLDMVKVVEAENGR